MAFDWNYTQTGGGTPGTLNSRGLFYQPNVPRNSQAGGIQGSDGRAYTGNVQGNELVERRLGTMLNRGDSSYLENARMRGLQAAARRGLGNSSIAAGSSERSAIEAAMPIAQADAQTYLQTRMQNQQDLNQNLMQERDIANRMLEAEYNREMSSSQRDQDRADAFHARQLQLQMQRENLAFEGEQQGLSRQQQEMMSRLGFSQQLGLNEQGFGFDLGRMGAQNQYALQQMGYQFDLTDRNAGRDFQRTIYRDNNSFANDRYNAMLGYDLGQMQSNSQFIQALIMSDPSIDPQSLSGMFDFLDSLGQRTIPNIFRRYGIGG
jgi:hypothetical protein